MKNTFIKYMIGILIFMLFAGISLIQDSVIKLASADNTSNFKVKDVNDIDIFNVAADGDFTMNGGNININSNLATLKLATNDNTSKIDITKNNGTSVLKIAGNGAIVGDGSGLSEVKSVAAYSQGNQSVYFHEGMIAGLNSYEAQIMRSVTINCPGPGILLAQATGYADWESKVKDYVRIWFWPNDVSPGDWQSPDTDNLRFLTDYGCTDSSDQYTSWEHKKTYTVPGAGNFTVYCCGDKPNDVSKVLIGDVSMQLIFFPTGGTGPSARITTSSDFPVIPPSAEVPMFQSNIPVLRNEKKSLSIVEKEMVAEIEKSIVELEKEIIQIQNKSIK